MQKFFKTPQLLGGGTLSQTPLYTFSNNTYCIVSYILNLTVQTVFHQCLFPQPKNCSNACENKQEKNFNGNLLFAVIFLVSRNLFTHICWLPKSTAWAPRWVQVHTMMMMMMAVGNTANSTQLNSTERLFVYSFCSISCCVSH